MPRFKYLGEKPRPGLVVDYGPTLSIRIPRKDGTRQEILADDQEVGFVAGQDIGVDITDARSLRIMRADPRFKEI